MTSPLDFQKAKTIAAALRELRARFKEAGLDSPDLDARILLMEATELSRTEIVARRNEAVSSHALKNLEDLVRRRLSNEPIDSILGHAEFYGRRFVISKDVLSPRPETEDLVGQAIEALKSVDSPHALDLGTGSGAILISILAEIPAATGIGADKSSAALHIAQQNSQTHDVSLRAEWIQSDWYSHIDGQFDLIVSNPPYITDAAMDDLSPEVANFDPDIALRGGEDGLTAYEKILAGAMGFLKPGGFILFEIGYDQGRSVPKMMQSAGFVDVRLDKDLSGHDRIVQGVRLYK